jgi:hypothetical protein
MVERSHEPKQEEKAPAKFVLVSFSHGATAVSFGNTMESSLEGAE